MADEAEFCLFWRQRPLYWATIAYVRAWWATDGARLAVIQRDHVMTIKMLRSIGVEYNVNRLIPSDEKSPVILDTYPGITKDPSAWLMCALLNEAAGAWPAEMAERVEACLTIICKARQQGVAKKDLVSATTKFMWFLKPVEWTVFDDLAATGLKVPNNLPAKERMKRFYSKLQEKGFVPLVQTMQATVDATDLCGLPATRILDTLFMACAGRGSDSTALENILAFQNLLPEGTRQPIDKLATSLQSQFGRHELIKFALEATV